MPTSPCACSRALQCLPPQRHPHRCRLRARCRALHHMQPLHGDSGYTVGSVAVLEGLAQDVSGLQRDRLATTYTCAVMRHFHAETRDRTRVLGAAGVVGTLLLGDFFVVMDLRGSVTCAWQSTTTSTPKQAWRALASHSRALASHSSDGRTGGRDMCLSNVLIQLLHADLDTQALLSALNHVRELALINQRSAVPYAAAHLGLEPAWSAGRLLRRRAFLVAACSGTCSSSGGRLANLPGGSRQHRVGCLHVAPQLSVDSVMYDDHNCHAVERNCST